MESKNSLKAEAQRTNKQNVLRKMYLLTEPAFQNVKKEIDNEKYLTLLDNELKQILNNKNLPAYKKWLEYRDVLIQYLNYREFLKESEEHGDKLCTEKLLNLEKYTKDLEAQMKTNANNKNVSIGTMTVDNEYAPIITMDETNISDDSSILKAITPEYKSTPKDKTIGNDTISEKIVTNKEKKRKSTTPVDQTQPSTSTSPQSRRKLAFAGEKGLQNESIIPIEDSIFEDANSFTAPAGREDIFGRSAEKLSFEPMEVSFAASEKPNSNQLDISSELLKKFDDEYISRHTIRHRLDAAPPTVRAKFLINNEYPIRFYSVYYYDKETDETKHKQINGLDISIENGNVIKYYTKSGVSRIKHVKEDSLNTIRIFLIDFHRKIDEEIENYHEQNGNYISTKPYSILNGANATSIIRYKTNSVITVPSEILDDVIQLMNETEMTEQEFKDIVTKMKIAYEKDIKRPNLSPIKAATVSTPRRIPALSAASAVARLTSTPSSARKKRTAAHLMHGEQTLSEMNAPAKKLQTNQKGTGYRWKTI